MDYTLNQKINKPTQGRASAGTGEPLQELIKRLYQSDQQIKKYIDYKIDYIKRGYEDMIIGLYEEIAGKHKTIETLKQNYTKKEIEELKTYYFQTPKNLNDLKGLSLATVLKFMTQGDPLQDKKIKQRGVKKWKLKRYC